MDASIVQLIDRLETLKTKIEERNNFLSEKAIIERKVDEEISQYRLDAKKNTDEFKAMLNAYGEEYKLDQTVKIQEEISQLTQELSYNFKDITAALNISLDGDWRNISIIESIIAILKNEKAYSIEIAYKVHLEEERRREIEREMEARRREEEHNKRMEEIELRTLSGNLTWEERGKILREREILIYERKILIVNSRNWWDSCSCPDYIQCKICKKFESCTWDVKDLNDGNCCAYDPI